MNIKCDLFPFSDEEVGSHPVRLACWKELTQLLLYKLCALIDITVSAESP